jgi:L-seryl-tRNA(Ser) seleniumtransferase
LLEIVEKKLIEAVEILENQKFRRVINATGVVLHTNLGRAPLSEAAQKAVLEAARYCTLEYDLTTGKRGKRGRQAEELLCELTGAEAAIIVNNCAAAAFLVLSALSAGGEAVVSRGELVEIGGDFRVPDVMAQSRTKLVEVGTTNRTKLKDFAAAITENTKLFVRVHPSNFRIIGFTAMPDLTKLAELAHERGILLYEDAGSGAIVDLSQFGLNDEPVIAESIRAGADVVTFSGDKLLGAVQAGLIVGKSETIEKLRKHPLYRALRVDKLAYAALAATLEIYRKETHFAEIPVLGMLAQTKEEIAERSENFIKMLQADLSGFESQTFNFQLAEGVSAIGGGSAPLTHPPTILISVRHDKLSAAKLETALRRANPPVISRIENDCVLLDLRTVSNTEEAGISAALREISVKS